MFTDELAARVSIASLRTALRPRHYKTMRAVRLTHGGVTCVVAIDVVAEPSCYGGQRRWFRCPRCARRTTVIGFSSYSTAVGCKSCLSWRHRPGAVVAARAPHLKAVGEAVEVADRKEM